MNKWPRLVGTFGSRMFQGEFKMSLQWVRQVETVVDSYCPKLHPKKMYVPTLIHTHPHA